MSIYINMNSSETINDRVYTEFLTNPNFLEQHKDVINAHKDNFSLEDYQNFNVKNFQQNLTDVIEPDVIEPVTMKTIGDDIKASYARLEALTDDQLETEIQDFLSKDPDFFYNLDNTHQSQLSSEMPRSPLQPPMPPDRRGMPQPPMPPDRRGMPQPPMPPDRRGMPQPPMPPDRRGMPQPTGYRPPSGSRKWSIWPTRRPGSLHPPPGPPPPGPPPPGYGPPPAAASSTRAEFVPPSDSSFFIQYIKDRDEATKIINNLYHSHGYVYFQRPSGSTGGRDGTFIKAVEILNDANQQPKIQNSKQMRFKKIYKIIKEFRQKKQFDIDTKGQQLAILICIDDENKIGELLKMSQLYGQFINRYVGRLGLINATSRTFNYLFGLNEKKLKIEKATKLYETYLEFSVLKDIEDEAQIKKVNDFFIKYQIYKRLAKKFVLTQSDTFTYNENDIFDADMEVVSDIFYQYNITEEIRKNIEKNLKTVGEEQDLEKLIKQKLANYAQFCDLQCRIDKLITKFRDEDESDEKKEKDYYVSSLEEKIKIINDKILYYDFLNNAECKNLAEEMYTEIIEEHANNTYINLDNIVSLYEDDMVQAFVDENLSSGPAHTGGKKYDTNNNNLYSDYNSEDDSNYMVGGLSFSREKRSSGNRKFNKKDIDYFMKYFKIITYNLDMLFTDIIDKEGKEDSSSSSRSRENFMNKYLNKLIGEKIKDDINENDDGVIEKYKKGIVNPEFLTEKLGSIDEYIYLAKTIIGDLPYIPIGNEEVYQHYGFLGRLLLKTLNPQKSENTIQLFQFGLIKEDLMNILIEHVTNIDTVKTIGLTSNFTNELEQKFTHAINKKIRTEEKEKELSQEHKDLLDKIFNIRSSDPKTIQEYKKKIRRIDDIIESHKDKGTLTFANVFTRIKNEEIFNIDITIDRDGITFHIEDEDINMEQEILDQEEAEKEDIVKLLEEKKFNTRNIEAIKTKFGI